MREFKGKVAVVTGAASGIGRSLALRCADEGMRVVLTDIEEPALVKIEKEIKARGGETLAVITDVSQSDSVKALAEKTITEFGAIHLLFNNAGVGPWCAVRDITLADWQWVLGVNLWSVIYGIHFFLPLMQDQGEECHIVNTASIASFFASTYHSLYAVSKFGILAFSEVLYQELEQENSNVGISVLCPSIVKTRIQEPERNRPSASQDTRSDKERINVNPAVAKHIQWLTEMSDKQGMEPEQVADITFQAIAKKRFYILTHPDSIKAIIKARMENILNDRNPARLTL